VVPANAADAHRPLGKEHDLAAILSHVEERQVGNDYTVRYQGKVYQIDRREVRTGLRGLKPRVEWRLDGSIAMRFAERYLRTRLCEQPLPATRVEKPAAPARPRQGPNAGGKSRWMDGFWQRPGGLSRFLAQGLRSETPPKNAAKEKPLGGDHRSPRGVPILRSQPRRIGLGHPLGRDPWRTLPP
jgi:hypothetical protein